MSHPPPVLNYDVLSTVLEQAERETLLSLMLCCRTLYQEGVRVLLAEPVCLHRPCWKERRFLVGSFTRFMSADGGQRWRFLRGLIFGDRSMFYYAAAKLAEGIKQAPNITSLVLLDADGLLRTYPELLTALASLENVKHLALTGAASHTCLLLESVRWPLVTAKLIGTPIRNPGPNILAKMHPTALFRCAQNTLVAMRCDSCDMFEYHSGNPTYPNVTFLDMTNTEPSTHEWVKAYPNVSSLRVSNRYYKADDVRDVRDEAWFQTAHERNMHALVDQCWPQLKRCDAFCVADLYALGLPCHIRAIKFDWTMTSRDLRFFPETMEHARPDHLQLYLTIQRLATFQTTFQQAANGLRNLGLLRITVEFGSDSMDEDIPHSLLQGVSAIGLLPNLRTLVLELDGERYLREWEAIQSENRKPRVEDRTLPSLSERSLITFDSREFCRALFSLAPSLEAVVYIIDGIPQERTYIDGVVKRTDVMDG